MTKYKQLIQLTFIMLFLLSSCYSKPRKDQSFSINNDRSIPNENLSFDRTITELYFKNPIVGINYYPQKNPWSLFWKNFSPAAIEKDFKLISESKFNTVRVFINYEDFTDLTNFPLYKSRLKKLLDLATKYNLKCIVTLFDFYVDYTNISKLPETYFYLETVTRGLENHPGILSWDIKNEINSDLKYGKLQVINWLKMMSLKLRELDKSHLITVSLSNFEHLKEVAPYVDYFTIHYYGLESEFENKISSAKKNFPNKQIVLGEFGYHTWKKATPDPHLSEHQYNYFKAIMASSVKEKLAGFLVWNLYDYPSSLKENFVLKNESVQNYMGILDNSGHKKPGMQAFQESVFIRDFQTKNTVSLETKEFEIIFKASKVGLFNLYTLSETNQKSMIYEGKIIKGVNSKVFKIPKKSLEDIIYMRKKLWFEGENILSLIGKPQKNIKEKIQLRLK